MRVTTNIGQMLLSRTAVPLTHRQRRQLPYRSILEFLSVPAYCHCQWVAMSCQSTQDRTLETFSGTATATQGSQISSGIKEGALAK